MKKYDKLEYVDRCPTIQGRKVEVTVKYDGSNGRLTHEDGDFMYGTRNQEQHDINDLTGIFNTAYIPIKKKIERLPEEVREELKSLLEYHVIFFEVCGRQNKHKLDYNWDMKFIVFDGWHKEECRYLPTTHPLIRRIIEILNFNIAEVLPFTTYKEGYEWIIEQDPDFVEGVVMKDYMNNERCKIVHPKNAEISSVKFAKKRGTDNHLESKFLFTHINDNRIEKAYNKIKAEEGLSGMRALGKTLQMIYKDLIEEGLVEFILNNKPDTIDLKYIRKQMPQIVRPIFMMMVQDG